MSPLKKFLSKLELENPFAHGQISQLFKKVAGNRQTQHVANDLDQISGLGWFAKSDSGPRKYSHEWLRRPEMENMQNSVNLDYAKLDPEVDEALHGVMNEYPITEDYRDEIQSLFGSGKMPSIVDDAKLLERLYNKPASSQHHVTYPEPNVLPDSNFDAYGERRRR